ncbi:MAG: hypothetical protein A4E61_01735 [Syntrophorhabdus sp. PtaB.Bin184]|nr:MAG: hypothetical protein A4E61_01735 [Syntrophorhabdus sp. PtaB.Bin184]
MTTFFIESRMRTLSPTSCIMSLSPVTIKVITLSLVFRCSVMVAMISSASKPSFSTTGSPMASMISLTKGTWRERLSGIAGRCALYSLDISSLKEGPRESKTTMRLSGFSLAMSFRIMPTKA